MVIAGRRQRRLNWLQFTVRMSIGLMLCLQTAAVVDCGISFATEADRIGCVSSNLINRYKLNTQLYRHCDFRQGAAETQLQRRLRRDVKPIFRGNPKPHSEVLANKFHMDVKSSEQTDSLVKLINKIASEYLHKCPPVIYYDSFVEESEAMILEILFKTFPITYYHGEINERYKAKNPLFKRRIDNHCKSYILFLSDPQMTHEVIGAQIDSRVVLIARSTQWKLRDFLASKASSHIVNLLVIGESLTEGPTKDRPYVLYTHKLYTDGLGSNTPVVLTSWIRGALSRPHVNLFPQKFADGFAGHSFKVTAVNQPPFIFRIQSLSRGGTTNTNWDGVEYRLLTLIAAKLNFSIDLTQPQKRPDSRSVIDDVQYQIYRREADIGMCGLYITEERITETDMSFGHSRDCASFITLASKALPKYRAIMGPFQWPVWACIIVIYLGAIFPIVYSDRLTLRHLIGNWGEMENMFWYVFGMFTNSLTFSGKYSWTTTTKTSTRILIGSYWLFTIIITSCYTGSIIAFVTLPAFPSTVDSVNDLLGLFFRVGTLDNSGWETWFQNSTHVPTAKLYKKMEFVANLEEGIGNVTESFFWNYAFLGSAAQLEFMVQKNFSDDNISKRSALHISEECFALFQVGFLYPQHSVYKRKIDSMILLAQQSGLVSKILNEVRWTMQRSASGRLLQASSSNALRERIQEERQLTTADTEGMFLLMAIGYVAGAVALVSEIVGGITNKCRQIMRRSRKSVSSAWSSRRSSAAEGGERTVSAQLAHEEHKAAIHKAHKAQREFEAKQNYGIRKFNLTKKTLKELYGNYYKPEPDYVLKDGKLLIETEETLSASSADCHSRDSSGDIPAIVLPRLHCKKKAMLVADVDVEREKKEDLDRLAAEAEESLAALDECLKRQQKSSESGDSVEVDENARSVNESVECGENGNKRENDIADEYELFGSLIVPEGPMALKLDDLNMFNDAAAAIRDADNELEDD